MTYINTDVTAGDVLATMVDTLNRKVNNVNNGITTHHRHPTYITKAMLREYVIELKAMWGMFVEARHYEIADAETAALCERVQGAIANVQALYPKRKH